MERGTGYGLGYGWGYGGGGGYRGQGGVRGAVGGGREFVAATGVKGD